MKNDKTKLKIRMVSSFSDKEKADVLLNMFDYLLIKLPAELKKQKLTKQTAK